MTYNKSDPMRDPIRFEFTTSPASTRETMLAATKDLYKGRRSLPSILITLVLTVLSGLGGLALASAIVAWFDANPSWWMLVGWFAGGAFYLSSTKILYTELANLVTKRPLQRASQAMSFDAEGLTYEAGAAVWTTPWHLIDAVVDSKNMLSVVVAGISFGLPKDVIGDEDTVATLLSDLQAQIDNA